MTHQDQTAVVDGQAAAKEAPAAMRELTTAELLAVVGGPIINNGSGGIGVAGSDPEIRNGGGGGG